MWGNISFNFDNNPFFIRFLSKLNVAEQWRATWQNPLPFCKFDQVACQWHCQLRKGLPVTLLTRHSKTHTFFGDNLRKQLLLTKVLVQLPTLSNNQNNNKREHIGTLKF